MLCLLWSANHMTATTPIAPTATGPPTCPKLDLNYCQAWAEALARSGSYDGADARTLLPRVALGLAVGADPASGASNITISKSKAVFSAAFQAALLVRRGVVRYDIVSASEECVELAWFRDGRKVGVSRFTIAEAKRANLTNKSVWQHYPEDLLFARALTRGIRRFAPETLAGFPAYTAEEMGADVPVQVEAPAAAPALPDRRDAAAVGAAVQDLVVELPANQRATEAQLLELVRLRTDLAIDRADWAKILHKRSVTTARNLSPAQAATLIEKLQHRLAVATLEAGKDDPDAADAATAARAVAGWEGKEANGEDGASAAPAPFPNPAL
jgi:hypothetical protein